MSSITYDIFKKIRSKGRGSVYTVKDFVDMGARDAVDQSLSRLQKRGKIRRITQGIYDYPKVNDKLGGQLSPDINAVAGAIARKNSMRIMISGALAANKVGLSTQVPAKTVYLTDGPSRKISIGNSDLVFRHASPKRMLISQKKSTVILQALKHIGKDNIDDVIINKMNSILTDDDKQQLSRDAQDSSAWLVDVVENIAESRNG